MTGRIRRLAALPLLPFALLAAALGSAGSAVAGRWGADYFPNVELTTQDGQKVRFYDDLLKDKMVAVNVLYTRCQDECPLETARLAQMKKALGRHMGRDFFIYSISMDPEHDTPEVLKAYAARFHTGPGWLFLTGRPEDIRLVTRKLGLSRQSDAVNKDGHAATLMVGNVAKEQWMRHSAADNPAFLATSIANFFHWPLDSRGRNYAEAQPITADPGQLMFHSRCSACHTVGQGDRIGPDLRGVTARREHAWLARYLAEPDRMRAEGDPIANALLDKYGGVPMPNLGLGSNDVAVLIGYLRAQSAAQPSHRDQ
jgi:protein SCO1